MGTNTVTVGAEAAKLAGLQVDLLQKLRDGQRTIEHFKWFLGLKKEECDQLIVKANSIIDDYFTLVNTFPLTIPEDYNHATRLDSFCKMKQDEVIKLFNFYKHTDAEFGNATTKLLPGQRFRIKVFRVKEIVSCDDCLILLKSEKAVLTGVQGLSLVYELAKDQIPKGTKGISLDKKTAFLENKFDGRHYVPDIHRYNGYSEERYTVGCTIFESCLGKDSCILCFCNLFSSE